MKTSHMICLLALAILAGCNRAPQTTSAPAHERVVSLAPNLTEIMCAIGAGDLMVGRTSACDFPPSAQHIPVIGGFGDPSVELLVASKPTLILDVALADESIGRKIESLGLRRQRIPCTRLSEIPQAVIDVGRLVHHETQANPLANDLKTRLCALQIAAQAVSHPPRVFVEIWCDPLMTAGTNSFLSELVSLAGGKNIGDEVPKEYFEVSSEWVIDRQPDVVLCLYMSANKSVRELVMHRPGWKSIPAVYSGRVYDGFDNNMILRPGPRVLDSIAALHRCIAGPPAP